MSRSITSAATQPGTYTWNGPVCHVCGRGYIEYDRHRCSPDDLRDLIAALQAKLAEVEAP